MEARIRRNPDGELDIEVRHDGGYSPDAMSEIVAHTYSLYGWARADDTERDEMLRLGDEDV